MTKNMKPKKAKPELADERFLEEVIENHRTVAEAYRKMLVSLEAKFKKKNK
jgi:hypothetical protein